MKNLKRTFILIISIFSIVAITGCQNKNAITIDEFKTKMNDLGYVLQDAKNQFNKYDFVKEAYIAAESNYNYQIEFYILEDIEQAKKFYENNKIIFEKSKDGVSTHTSINVNNYAKFILETNDKYKLLSRIDNTVIFVNSDLKYKNNINEVLKKLGY